MITGNLIERVEKRGMLGPRAGIVFDSDEMLPKREEAKTNRRSAKAKQATKCDGRSLAGCGRAWRRKLTSIAASVSLRRYPGLGKVQKVTNMNA